MALGAAHGGRVKTFIIAEIGSCHDGDLGNALYLIDAAAEAGCDAVKAQFWSNPHRMAVRRNAPAYLDIYRRYAVPVTWLSRLRLRCAARGLAFLCSTYLPEDVATVAPFVDKFKISSFEAKDADFIAAHAPYRLSKGLIVSIGMMTGPDVSRLTDTLFHAGYADRWNMFDDDHVTLMHCVSAYPTPANELNLRALRTMYLGITTKHTGLGVKGFSDHSGLIETGALAVAAGATVVEAHLKLRTTDPANPDAGEHALEPSAFADYVAVIREAEIMLGDGQKRPMPSESAMQAFQVQA